MDDGALLEKYARSCSQEAFTELVKRYLPLVARAARRQVRELNLADDVTQAVFIVLARRAGTIQASYLTGWLLKTTYFAARDVLKQERRRAHREHQAAAMKPTQTQTTKPALESTELEPHLDRAMMRLKDLDRSAIAMRFFEEKSFEEIGAALNTSERAAMKRTHRALEKLRGYLSSSGITLATAPALSDALVQLARQPVVLTPIAAVVTHAMLPQASSALVIAKATSGAMAWASAKVAVITCAIVSVAAIGAVGAIQLAGPPPANSAASTQPATAPIAAGPKFQVRKISDGTAPAEQLPDFLGAKSKVYFVEKQVLLDDSAVAYFRPEKDQMGNWIISFHLTPAGGAEFQKITKANIRNRLAMVVDGKVLSAPTVQSEIGRYGIITGQMNEKQATQICDSINSVAAGPFTFSEPTTIKVLPGKGAAFVELSSGNVVAPPPTIELTPGSAPFFKPTDEIKQWIQDRNLDLLVQSDGKSASLTTLEAYEMPYTQASREKFGALQPHDIFAAFAKRDPGMVSGFTPISQSIGSPDPELKVLRTRNGDIVAVEITAVRPGDPIAIRTQRLQYPAN